jgi:hypothetical protein
MLLQTDMTLHDAAAVSLPSDVPDLAVRALYSILVTGCKKLYGAIFLSSRVYLYSILKTDFFKIYNFYLHQMRI